MNRRDFLKRLAALGLAVPSTKLIFDLGANSYKSQPEFDWQRATGTLDLSCPMSHTDFTKLFKETYAEFIPCIFNDPLTSGVRFGRS